MEEDREESAKIGEPTRCPCSVEIHAEKPQGLRVQEEAHRNTNICSVSKYLLSVLDMHNAGDTVVTKTDKTPAFMKPVKWWDKKINV